MGAKLLENLILEANQKYSAEYKIGEVDGISNHLPMCLSALLRLGASDARLRSFYTIYVDRLQLRLDTPGFDASHWESTLGKHKYNNELSQFFLTEIDRLGIRPCVAKYLAPLSKGIGGAAFHPVIRLAYALELGVKSEIAEALASWTMGYLDFGTQSSDKHLSQSSARQILACLSTSSTLKSATFTGSSVVARMLAVAKHQSFWNLLEVPEELTLEELADLALKVFLSKPTFTGLHLVTACHATRVLMNHIGGVDNLMQHLWIPFCIAFVTIGSPTIRENFDFDSQEWSGLQKKALESDDDHWCKFVYSCFEESKAYGTDLYRMAATVYLTS